MRLLEIAPDGSSLSFTNDLLDKIPPYVILSHTWGNDEDEVTYDDIITGNAENKAYGYAKIRFCMKQACLDGIRHMWVDTCCINKSNSTELSQAINSMFRWYKESAKCYVYLPDVSINQVPDEIWKSNFLQNRWATRGWTLQELLAPSSVEFFSSEGQRIGNKQTLEALLHDMTAISIDALRGTPLCEFTDLERMSWMEKRQTKHPEDKAYALLGMFGVQMPLIYGEGSRNAFARLRETIKLHSGRRDHVASITKCHKVIPFGRRTDFVGRQDILESLMTKIPPNVNKDACQMTVIEGLGGIGKTQIALEAAYRVREKNPDCSVFWIPVVDKNTIENAYRKIGKALEIPGIDDNRADVKSLVTNALSDDSSGPWLLVYDNVDDIDLMFGSKQESCFYDPLPANPNGSILCTTRNHEVTIRFDISLDNVLSVHEMNENEASQLLRQKLKEPQLRHLQSTHELLEFLAYLPLAIRQASAYMARTNMTTTKYLAYCKSSDQTQINLLSQHFDDKSRYMYDNKANPIATTWLISFKHMSDKYPLAAQYLMFICYLAEKDIPTSILPQQDDELERDQAIGALENYAFISLRDDSDSFDIHRLVRLAARNWTKQQGKMQIKAAIEHISSVYPDPSNDNKSMWIRYLPHGDAALNTWTRENNDNVGWKLLIKTGESHFIIGKAQLAESKYRQASEISEKTLGLDHPKTIASINGLATMLRQQAKYSEAEKRQHQILQSSTKMLGPKHANTIAVMNGLAELYRQSGRYHQAEPEHEQTLRLCSESLGESHRNTLASMNNLVIVLFQKGDYQKAESLCREAIQKKTGLLGPDHADTLASMNSLAVIFDLQGKYEESERQHRENMQRNSEVYGGEHPETMACVTNLASVLYRQGKYNEAERQHRWAIEAITKEATRDHPDVLANVNGLAEAIRQQGRSHEAEQLHRATLKSIMNILGPDHPSTLFVTTNLAATLLQRGNHDEAEGLFRQSLALKTKILGQDHPSTVSSASGLADVLLAQRRYEEAEGKYRHVLHSRIRILGIHHPLSVTSMNNFAFAYCLRRRNWAGRTAQMA
ncbi:hypothetical protein AA0111_g2633 [Alternaria arborescens]|uniref:hypothetical protein n=1 Tax=Alternaria arborescens TaxID=156630 RepID=UPI001074E5F9|nr:hypothetical protein AA0111_g2633 [Alternaria arborescens]RYO37679.1 hypothetical protein AA0111_g2633 [Alternaria arborescens]